MCFVWGLLPIKMFPEILTKKKLQHKFEDGYRKGYSAGMKYGHKKCKEELIKNGFEELYNLPGDEE